MCFWRLKLRFAWQAQGFWHVGCKNVGRHGGFEEGPQGCLSRGSAKISCFVMSAFEASDAEPVERLQISSSRNVAQQGSFRVAVAGVRMPRLNFSRGRRSTFHSLNSLLHGQELRRTHRTFSRCAMF